MKPTPTSLPTRRVGGPASDRVVVTGEAVAAASATGYSRR